MHEACEAYKHIPQGGGEHMDLVTSGWMQGRAEVSIQGSWHFSCFLLCFGAIFSAAVIPLLASLPTTFSSFVATQVLEDPVFQKGSSVASRLTQRAVMPVRRLTGRDVMAAFISNFNLRFKHKACSYNLKKRSMWKVAKEVKLNTKGARGG